MEEYNYKCDKCGYKAYIFIRSFTVDSLECEKCSLPLIPIQLNSDDLMPIGEEDNMRRIH